MSRTSEVTAAMLYAYGIGYRISKNGKLLNPFGEELHGTLSNNGYLRRSIYENKKLRVFFLHRLAAYQKFGEILFDKGIAVRHLNGDPTDNTLENIAIGTRTQNQRDISEEVRKTRRWKGMQNPREVYDKLSLRLNCIRRKMQTGWYQETLESQCFQDLKFCMDFIDDHAVATIGP